jgi:hypothetical protein
MYERFVSHIRIALCFALLFDCTFSSIALSPELRLRCCWDPLLLFVLMKLEDIDEFKPIGSTIMVEPLPPSFPPSPSISFSVIPFLFLFLSIPQWNMSLMMLMVMK